MRKQLFLLSLFLFATLTTWAERIDVATARKVAQHVAPQQAGSGLRSADDLSVVYAAAPGKQADLRAYAGEGDADYFVFNVGTDRGFVIVSGEDRVRPVLGYADKGTFDPDNLPDNMRAWLANYQEQITWAADHLDTASPEISAEWSRYLSGAALRADNGVLLETANWDQGDPYNRMTPEISGQHAVTGCVATAMGIIMRYHQYPNIAPNPPSTNTYSIEDNPTTVSIDYSAGYDWSNMLLSYEGDFSETQANAVATLLYHCGANVEMNYGKNESSAYAELVASALTDVFGYSPSIRYLRKEAYRWGEWKSMIRQELDAKYPLIYNGDNKTGGHAFICDGYEDDFFHINWGWGGYQNGYFILSALDVEGNGNGFSQDQSMILNIRSGAGGSKYVYYPYMTAANYFYDASSLNIGVSFDITYTGIEDQSCLMELGVVDNNGNIVQKPVVTDNYYNLQADKEGWSTYADISRNITLTSALTEGQKVVMLCSTDGTNWEPMRMLETVSPGVDMNGVIQPAVDDPNDPEQPMNVGLYWNQFESQTYAAVTGLTNISASQNIRAVFYSLSNVKEDVTLRYVISDFATWKDKLAVYQGTDDNVSQAGAGTPVEIKAAGYFDIVVPTSSIEDGIYFNYLKILSDQSGQLNLDIQVYSSSSTDPVFESKGQKIIFVETMTTEIDKKTIEGFVHTKIPFSVQLSDVDPLLTGTDLYLRIDIVGMHENQIKILKADGSEIPVLVAEDDEQSLYTEPVHVGDIEQGSYSFYLIGNVACVNDPLPYIYVSSIVDGTRLSDTNYLSHIMLKESPLQAEDEGTETVKVWTTNGQAHIFLPQDEKVQVVTFGGRLYQSIELPAGETVMPLPQGAYIIRIGETSYKVVI